VAKRYGVVVINKLAEMNKRALKICVLILSSFAIILISNLNRDIPIGTSAFSDIIFLKKEFELDFRPHFDYNYILKTKLIDSSNQVSNDNITISLRNRYSSENLIQRFPISHSQFKQVDLGHLSIKERRKNKFLFSARGFFQRTRRKERA